MHPWHPSVKIIKFENSIFAIYKPCGILSQPNKPGVCKQSIMQAPYNFDHEAYETQEGWVYLLNRLDSPTSGIVILCTDYEISKQIKTAFKEHRVNKIYYALVKGRFPVQQLLWQDRLLIQKQNNKIRTKCASNAGIVSKTTVSLLKNYTISGENLSLVQLHPHTGRSHQLRVQCAHHNFPILGDKTYGNFNCNHRLKAHRLFLHAQHIDFSLPTGLSFNATCDPEEWELTQSIAL